MNKPPPKRTRTEGSRPFGGIWNAISGILIGFSFAIRTFFYHWVADLDWIDSFHMACLILTGIGPVAEMKTKPPNCFHPFMLCIVVLLF
jgi:hypothetical protein